MGKPLQPLELGKNSNEKTQICLEYDTAPVNQKVLNCVRNPDWHIFLLSMYYVWVSNSLIWLVQRQHDVCSCLAIHFALLQNVTYVPKCLQCVLQCLARAMLAI